ncbi:MAG: protein-L-isoaspartate(D-aspartate) O-methyltransferase [Bacillota bacterium]
MVREREREKMIKDQIVSRGIKSEEILQAFHEVPRHVFVDQAHQNLAYTDQPLPIGQGQTISQPYIIASMLRKMEIESVEKVLEIGSGCGYVLAIMSRIVSKVYGIERQPQLAQMSKSNIYKLDYENIEIKVGDGRKGWPEKAPFDGIIVSASTDKVPKPLLEQLEIGGRLIIPLGGDFLQKLVLFTKENEEEITREELEPVRFVPLKSGIAGE